MVVGVPVFRRKLHLLFFWLCEGALSWLCLSPELHYKVLKNLEVAESKIKAHEIHRGKGLEVRLSLALAIIQVTERNSSAKSPEGTIDGDTTYLHLHNFAMGLEGKEYSLVLCTRHSAHKTFGPTDLTSTLSACTQSVFGGIGHRTQAFRSGVRCSNHQATHGPDRSLHTPYRKRNSRNSNQLTAAQIYENNCL
ncbi:hypothetical protein TNCV_1636601 [Trichonephila clavipes]|nr:hypothetical protein TNCV_1636601 [Trichonephila clavipes]